MVEDVQSSACAIPPPPRRRPPPPASPGHQRVDTGFGKLVYARNFLNSLIPKMMRKSLTDPRVAEVIDLKRLQKISTIGEHHPPPRHVAMRRGSLPSVLQREISSHGRVVGGRHRVVLPSDELSSSTNHSELR